MVPSISSHQVVTTQMSAATAQAVQTNSKIASLLSRWGDPFPAGTEALTLKQWLFIEIIERIISAEQSLYPWEKISGMITGLWGESQERRSQIAGFFADWRTSAQPADRQKILIMGLLYQSSDDELTLPMSSFNLPAPQEDCPVADQRFFRASGRMMGVFSSEIESLIQETLRVLEKQCNLFESLLDKPSNNQRKKRGKLHNQKGPLDPKLKEFIKSQSLEMGKLSFVLRKVVRDFRQVNQILEQRQVYEGSGKRELDRTTALITDLLHNSKFLLRCYELYEAKIRSDEAIRLIKSLDQNTSLIMPDKDLEEIISFYRSKPKTPAQNKIFEIQSDGVSLEESFREMYDQLRRKYNRLLPYCEKSKQKKIIKDMSDISERQLKNLNNIEEGIVCLGMLMQDNLFKRMGVEAPEGIDGANSDNAMNEKWDAQLLEYGEKLVRMLQGAIPLMSGIEANLTSFQAQWKDLEQPEIDWSEFERWDSEVRSVRHQRSNRTRSSSTSSTSTECTLSSDEEIPQIYQEEPVQEVPAPSLTSVTQFVDNLAVRVGPIDVIADECMKLILDTLPKTLAVPAVVEQDAASLARMAYRESYNHLFMAACGFSECLNALATGDIKRLGVALPMYLMDLHVSLEQQATKVDLLEGKETPCSHSLVQRYREAGMWNELDNDQRQHLRAIDQAIIWYRYPHSSLSKCQAHGIPEGLKWISYCDDLLAVEYGASRAVPSADEKRVLARFIISSFHQTITLLAGQVGLDSETQGEVQALADVFSSGGYIESKLFEKLNDASVVAAGQRSGANTDVLASIRKIGSLPIHTEGARESRMISNALKDVQHHYMRLLASREMAGGAEQKKSSTAWHARNLMNVQWLVEQLLMCYYVSAYRMPCYQHDFQFYASVVDLPDIKLSDFNFGTFHYPQRKTRDPLFDAWVQAVENDRQNLAAQDFTVVSGEKRGKKKTGHASLREIENRSQRGVEASHQLLVDLIKSQRLDAKLIAV